MVKRVNLRLAWKMSDVTVVTNLTTVHRWIKDGLMGKNRQCMKAANEMLMK